MYAGHREEIIWWAYNYCEVDLNRGGGSTNQLAGKHAFEVEPLQLIHGPVELLDWPGRIEVVTGGRPKGVVEWGEGVTESVEDPGGESGDHSLRLNSNQTRDNGKNISASIFPNTVGQQTSKRRGNWMDNGQHRFELQVIRSSQPKPDTPGFVQISSVRVFTGEQHLSHKLSYFCHWVRGK
jgi:hypothetical protein